VENVNSAQFMELLSGDREEGGISKGDSGRALLERLEIRLLSL